LNLDPFDLSEESSEYQKKEFHLESSDTLKEVKQQYEKYKAIIFNELIADNSMPSYVVNNIEKCIHTRTLYFCEFVMSRKPPIFKFQYLSTDENFTFQNYSNVKIVLCKNQKICLNNMIKSCKNFFSSYIQLRDINKNVCFKGILKAPFEKFINYFKQNLKTFESVEKIQIEVFLFKWELFRDTENSYNRNNFNNNDESKNKSIYENLEKLRIYDLKRKMLENNL